MRFRLILSSVIVVLCWSAEASAATRTITGTLYRPNGTVWAGGTLTVRLLASFSNVGQTVVPQTWRVAANAAGVVSVAILVPDTGSATYTFTLPDGSTATATLGAGAALALETIFTTALSDPAADVTLANLIASLAVGLAPPTTARNVIQPTADVVPVTVKARAAGQTANLTEWKNTSDVVVASVSPAGVFTGGFVASGLTVVNVKDAPYNATGDGTTNDRTALDAAATASSTGAPLYFPRGTYAIASSWTTPVGVALQFAPGAVLKPASAVVVTISGPVVAPATQIFDTSVGGSFTLLRQNALVEWFGADNTGVADSTVATVAAGEALSRGQGGVVQFGPGKYLVNAVYTGQVSGITWNGAGAYSSATPKGTLLFTNSTTLDVLKIAPASAQVQSIVISNLTVMGRTSDTTGNGLVIDASLQTVSHVQIMNVIAADAKQAGVLLRGGEGSGGFLFDVTIDNLKSYGSDIALSTVGRVSELVITKPYLAGVTTALSLVGGSFGAEADSITLTQPILGGGVTGLLLQDANNVSIRSLYTESLTGRLVWLKSARRLIIEGGSMRQTGTSDGIVFHVSPVTSDPNDRIYINAPGWNNTSDRTRITYTGGTSTEVHFGSHASGPFNRTDVTGTEVGANQFRFDALLHTEVTLETVGGTTTFPGTIISGNGLTTPSTGVHSWTSRGGLSMTADGVGMWRNNAGSNFTRFMFGGSTDSYNAIARNAVNGFTLESAAGTATWNDASTASSGTVGNRYLFGIAAPTLTATNTSVTDTVASTVYIGGAPTAGTNTTIGAAYALNVNAGKSLFNDGLGIGVNPVALFDVLGPTVTGSDATSLVRMNQTLNTTGAPIVFDLNITDTASDAAMTLFRVRSSSTDRLTVSKTGTVITSGTITSGNGLVTPSTGVHSWTSRGGISMTADGVGMWRNNGGTDFTRFMLGGSTDAFNAISTTVAVGGKAQGIIIQQADGTPAVFADLGAATNGAMIYCSDCTAQSNPCTGSGTGAYAHRLNGAWDCR